MPGVLPDPSGPSPKVNISSGPVPAYISASQAPTKKSPWRTIREVEYVQRATATLPEELYDIIWRDVDASTGGFNYAKVIMKLEDILQGDFFNEYIKRGNILMLSEGQDGADEVFSLSEGTLRLELSKELYERAGLQGNSIQSGGRKHVKSKYLVEMNLRLPSMLHGKKGFERLVWAAKNVLNRSLNWLFVDLNQEKGSDGAKQPITTHHPIFQTLSPRTQTLSNILSPSTLTTSLPLSSSGGMPSEETQEMAHDLFEYLDMLTLASPRVQSTDKTDPYISRYQVPDLPNDAALALDDTSRAGGNVKTVTWTGLITTQWMLELLCAIIKLSRTKNLDSLPRQAQWLALSVSAHKTQAIGRQLDGYTILLQPQADSTDPTSNNEIETDVDVDVDVDLANENAITALDGPQRSAAADHTHDIAMTEDPRSDAESEAEAEAEAENTENRRGANTDVNVDIDVDMPDPQAPLQRSNKQSAKTRSGFQRYLCAEYVDSLTL
ncbi:hypothetical protein H2202_006522 [Exophiala xenobiotica]|nr:hypothetical protein H2202_006522 [Exophiala xenobiotica]